jgi:hypothetical protein
MASLRQYEPSGCRRLVRGDGCRLLHGKSGGFADVLVPVPGSKVDLEFVGTPRTAQLAEAIAAALDEDAFVADVLRQSEPIPSANEEGGTRNASELFDHR